MEFSPRKCKSNTYCSVYGCKSRAWKDATVRFFQFPEKNKSAVKIINKFNEEEAIDRLTAWERILKIGKKVTPSMRVCSLHFMPDDFIPSRNHIHHLKKIAVPSVNLPSSTIEKKLSSIQKLKIFSRKQRLQRRVLRKEVNSEEHYMSKEYFNGEESERDERAEIIEREEEIQEEPVEKSEIESCHLKLNSKSIIKVDIGIQVCSDFIDAKFWTFIKSDSELSSATGIPNLTLLNTIEKLVKMVQHSSTHQNLNLDLRDIIIMTFMKLRQNMSYAMLAVLFQSYTAESCKIRILEMIKILYICLKPAIFWPSANNITKNLSQCFEGFEDVRIVLNCTEVPIQKPQKLCCQIITYSYYMSSYTIKFMTGVTPTGLISFISKAYGGRSSDEEIVEQSGILQILEKGDKIMVDRGFTVNDICKKNGVKVIMPPFLKDQKQFSKTEALLTHEKATTPVHVERTNQRLKAFTILHAKMPTYLLSVGEEIFTIVCAIVNLSAPILKNDEF